jgi:predicted TIM-barrel fold metal-dependent hydrolase
VLVAVSPEDRYVGECARREPGRFAAVTVYDAGRAVPEQVDEARAAGFRALRMEVLGEPSEAAVERLAAFAVLRRMAASGMVVWFYGSLDQLRLLARVLERLPALVVVLNHLGFCPGSEPGASLAATLELARQPTVNVVLSGEYAYSGEAYPHADLGGRTRSIYEAFGAQRLMRASDFPWIDVDPGYGATLDLLDRHLPDIGAGERASIAGGTALRLLWDGDAVPSPQL